MGRRAPRWLALVDVFGTLVIGSFVLSYIEQKDFFYYIDIMVNESFGAMTMFLAFCRRGL